MQIKITLISVICFISSSTVYADYDEADLKKLFTDKSQRIQIDAARSGNYTGSELKKTSEINVSGYVKRGDGRSVVWVNDKSTLDNLKMGDVRVHHSSIGKNKKVTISVDGKTAQLKPGETWIKETGKVVDSHE